MAGIYLHIPYCKQACHYCDFHFSTNLKTKTELVQAICKEIEIQKDYLGTKSLESIYFGGGTPSMLSENELNQIFETIYKCFSPLPSAEITFEANPDDLTPQKLQEFKKTPINRLSIGIQTFNENTLSFLNRAHSKEEALNCIKNAQDIGFDKLNLDLIYGIQTMSLQDFEKDVTQLLSLNSQHISAYCLTIEEKTTFGKWLKKGKLENVNDQQAIEHYQLMIDLFTNKGFEQYEISNFAKNENYAKHNTNYWKGKKYLGIGPGAHSFDGKIRQYNISNNPKYITAISDNIIPFDSETLTQKDFVNEYIMTSLRTKWGTNLNEVGNLLGENFLLKQESLINDFLKKKLIHLENNTLFLTSEGKLLADHISSELFI